MGLYSRPAALTTGGNSGRAAWWLGERLPSAPETDESEGFHGYSCKMRKARGIMTPAELGRVRACMRVCIHMHAWATLCLTIRLNMNILCVFELHNIINIIKG